MNMDNHTKMPRRLRRLHTVFSGKNDPTYFLTICVKDRQTVLANGKIHQRFIHFNEDSLKRYGWWVSCFVILPDHLHLFATRSREAIPLGLWIKALKAMVGQREIKWQVGFFDHLLRSDESRLQKWDYVRQNPVRAGLVTHPEEWPFAAMFNLRDGTRIDLEG